MIYQTYCTLTQLYHIKVQLENPDSLEKLDLEVQLDLAALQENVVKVVPLVRQV